MIFPPARHPLAARPTAAPPDARPPPGSEANFVSNYRSAAPPRPWTDVADSDRTSNKII